MFPYAVHPDPGDDAPEASRLDDRGPDTANRILLHGARHHDRGALFLHWGQARDGWGWQATPDWRADRAAIRVALVLHGRLGVGVGDRVAVWMPLGPEWAQIERAVWSLGAVSVPAWPEWPLERVAAVLAESRPEVLFAPSLVAVEELASIGGRPEGLRAIVPLEAPGEQGDDWLSLTKFLEYGGVQDTPERASMWRTYARSVGPDAPASLEYGEAPAGPRDTSESGRPREVSQGGLVEWAERFTRRFPPRNGGTRLLATGRPSLVARVLVVAGWADGVTRTAFATGRVARDRSLELEPDLVAAPGGEAAELMAVLAASDAGRREADADARERAFVSIDGRPPGSADLPPGVRDVDGAELVAASAGSPGRGRDHESRETDAEDDRDRLEKRTGSA